jgi:methionyl-tRNA formyltransferase
MVNTRSLRVAVFGTPAFAVPTLRKLLESRHTVVAVVSQPDRPRGRGQKLQLTPTRAVAEAHGVRVLQPQRVRDEQFLRDLREMQLDLGVVAAYGKILPEELLAVPRLGMINVHASVLPAYRGAAPVHRAIIDGCRETGVTIMRVVRELDAGPMMAVVRRPIGAAETSVDVEQGLAELGAPLLVSVVDQLATGTASEEPQDDSRASYAPKILKSEGTIDWSLPAERIHNLVRGLHPWPLVSAVIAGRRCLVHRTELTERTSDASGGTVVAADKDDLAVAAGDGRVLRILQIQPEGRRVMSGREFLAGHGLRVGTRLEPA